MQPVDLCDELSFARGETGRTEVELSCSDPSLPTDSGNLVHRAATAFLQQAGKQESVRIYLDKRIPLAAGLGGGSSNAATTLLALNELHGHPLSTAQLSAIAASLGSDIPFFLQSGPAQATGRGEIVTPLQPFPALRNRGLLLIHPGFGVSTAWAYQALAGYPAALQGRFGRAQTLVAALQQGDLRAAAPQLYNSLEAPVLAKFPLLALYQEFLRAEGALVTLMSGSGSTTFGIAAHLDDARRLEQRIQQKFGPCWTAVVSL